MSSAAPSLPFSLISAPVAFGTAWRGYGDNLPRNQWLVRWLSGPSGTKTLLIYLIIPSLVRDVKIEVK